MPSVHIDDGVDFAVAAGGEVDELVWCKGARRVVELDDGVWLAYRLRVFASLKQRIRLKSTIKREGRGEQGRRSLVEPDTLLAGAVVSRDRPCHAPLVYGLCGYTACE